MVENTANGRRGAGTQNHCMHRKDAIIEDILAWRPFDHIILTTPQVPGAPKILMSYAFGGLADGGAHFEVHFAKPKPKDLPFLERICRTCKASSPGSSRSSAHCWRNRLSQRRQRTSRLCPFHTNVS